MRITSFHDFPCLCLELLVWVAWIRRMSEVEFFVFRNWSLSRSFVSIHCQFESFQLYSLTLFLNIALLLKDRNTLRLLRWQSRSNRIIVFRIRSQFFVLERIVISFLLAMILLFWTLQCILLGRINLEVYSRYQSLLTLESLLTWIRFLDNSWSFFRSVYLLY